MSQHINPKLQSCIAACTNCHQICLSMAMTYCLQKGGKHVEETHLKLMVNCADICQLAADFMLSASPLHGKVCAACADVCEACAESCQTVGTMDDCVTACRSCAASCREMAAM